MDFDFFTCEPHLGPIRTCTTDFWIAIGNIIFRDILRGISELQLFLGKKWSWMHFKIWDEKIPLCKSEWVNN